MKGGTCFTTDELGNCPVGQKNHLSYKTYNARMECLERVRLMAPELPPKFLGLSWTVRAMAYCKGCAFSWGTSTGGKFKDEIDLVVASLGTHYAGCERVEANRRLRARHPLKLHLIKKDNPDAFLEFVQQMRKWIPHARTDWTNACLRAVQEDCLSTVPAPGFWRQEMRVSGGSSIDLPGSSNAVAFSAFDETPHRIRQQVTAGYCTCKAFLPETVYTTAPRAQEAQQCLRTCMSCETLSCKRAFGHNGMHNCGSYRCRPIYVQEDAEENS